MKSKGTTSHHLEKIGAISGILSIIFYLSAAVLPFLPDYISRLLAFTFPLLWTVAFMGLYSFLKKESHTPTLEIAYLFGIIGAAIACSFIVVQQANFIWHDTAMEATKSEEAKSLLRASFKGANRVQSGLDVAFDIFITISWFLFGINIAKSPNFNKLLGWIGCLISAGLLILNMWTFPTPPADNGLIDLGPFLGLWTLIVFVWFTRIVFKDKSIIEE
ncbi:DUF4386 family protein [Polaribacter batillariae]|uniref:DUF4386 family protein n=1 Tax=Polaribacter batillariae TaxID=2808900 RepID=A0ABX7SV21_9FLAO|nr:DUF4386 family protein [Polaribacter batillariae]QTD38080.1 DUF4386 family protein [Polaribacter batillariae]